MKILRRAHPNTIPGKRFDRATGVRTSVRMGTNKGDRNYSVPSHVAETQSRTKGGYTAPRGASKIPHVIGYVYR